MRATSTFAGVINIDCQNGGTTATEKGVSETAPPGILSRRTKTTLWTNTATPLQSTSDFITGGSNWSGALGNDLQNDYLDSFGIGNTISGYIRQLRPQHAIPDRHLPLQYCQQSVCLPGNIRPIFTPFLAPATPGPLPGELYKDYIILSSTTDGAGNLKFTLNNSGGLAVLAGMQIQGWLPGEGRSNAFSLTFRSAIAQPAVTR